MSETTPKPWDRANVTVSSIPPGAEIQVDDKFLGHTPAKLALDVGERAITITKAGYQRWQRKLHVLPGSRQTLAAELERIDQ